MGKRRKQAFEFTGGRDQIVRLKDERGLGLAHFGCISNGGQYSVIIESVPEVPTPVAGHSVA